MTQISKSSILTSLIVPIYNAAPYVEAFCESVLAQSCRNFELLMLDDGSTDQSWDVIQKYSRDPRIRLFRWDRNRGLNAAWSELLSLSRGQYWCSPGADDILDIDFLASRMELALTNPHALFVHGPPRVINSSGEPSRPYTLLGDRPQIVDASYALEQSLNENHFNQPGMCVRRDLTEQVLPYFNTRWVYAPDWYLWLMLLSIGTSIVWDPKPLYSYRVHETSLSLHPSKKAIRAAEGRLVPLCGLSTAARFSHTAAGLWVRFRNELYHLWLMRAMRLAASRQLKLEWQEIASLAYRNQPSRIPMFLEASMRGVRVLRKRRAPFVDQPHQNGVFNQVPQN